MFKNYGAFVADIDDALSRIMFYTEDMSVGDFLGETKTSDAVIYNLEKISAASGQVPEKVRYLARDVNWDELVLLREIITTGITYPNRVIAWEAVEDLLPPLAESIGTLKEWANKLAARESMGRGMQTPEQEYERWY